MNNEPVAWKSTLQSKWFIPNEEMETGKYDKQFWTPLYTHTAKTLTDEEISKEIDIVYEKMLGEYIEEADLWNLVKSILKKVSEKWKNTNTLT